MTNYNRMSDAQYANFLDEIIEEKRPKSLSDEGAFSYHLFVEELAEASQRIKVLIEENERLAKLSQPWVELGNV